MTDAQTLARRRWLGLGLLASAQFVVVLDASIVNVALPSIGRALDFSQSNLAWVVNSYVLTFGGFLLLGGRIADLLGRRRVFMGGLIVFALASLAGGFATTEGQLIAARAVQGLGAAILSPAALAIVTTTFSDGAERNKALGVWGAVAGSGGAAGVLLGGVLTDSLGWEWVLWVNVPIALGAAALAPALIGESRSTSASRTFDVAGAVSITASLDTAGIRAGRRGRRRVGIRPDDRAAGGLRTPARGLRDRGAALGGAAGALPDLPVAHAHRRQRRRAPHRRIALLDVLLHLAVHAAGARIQPDQERLLVPAAGPHDHPGGRDRVPAGHPAGIQARAPDRARVHRCGADLVRPGVRRAAAT